MVKWKTLAYLGLVVLSLVAVGCERENEGEEDEAAEAAEKPAAPLVPGQPVAITEDKPGLLARAKIQPEQARQIALNKIPNGTVTKGELEEEDGKLIYSFDITVPGQKGITELHIDALTGDVLKTEHEDEGKETQ